MNQQISDELVSQIMKKVNSQDDEKRDIEELDIKIENVRYGFRIIENSGWEDDGRGKYDYKSTISQLASYDNQWDLIDVFDIYFEQCSSRTGSYYSDYYYSYDPIERLNKVEKVIPEQIIPEHIIIEWEEYKK